MSSYRRHTPATRPMNALSGAAASNLATSRFPLISSGSQPNQGSGLNESFEADLSLQRRRPVRTRSITSGLSSWQLRTGIPRPPDRKLGTHVMRGTERPAPPSTSRALPWVRWSRSRPAEARYRYFLAGQVVQRPSRTAKTRCRNIGASCYRGDCRSLWPAAGRRVEACCGTAGRPGRYRRRARPRRRPRVGPK
jgi:hypothetical protein